MRRKILNLYMIGLTLSLLGVVSSNALIVFMTSDDIIEEIEQLDTSSNLLILGTSKTFASGSENLFYKNRIKAGVELIKKIEPERVILSGSHPSDYYNEPLDMRNSLFENGLDTSNYILDGKGNDTFSSIKNYKDRFGEEKLIIITQKFHAYRTLLICRKFKVNAKVYPAEDVSVDITNKPVIREVFARIDALFNFYFQ